MSVVLTKRPVEIDIDCIGDPRGFSLPRRFPFCGKEFFITLAPEDAVYFTVELEKRWLDRLVVAQSRNTKVMLIYSRNGNEFGRNAWIGVVKATFEKERIKPSETEPGK